MERLTKKLSDDTKPKTLSGRIRRLIKPNGIYKATILKEYNKLYDRLVEYEDLGVTPEQVRQMDAEFSRVSEELGRYQGVEAWFKERYKANISIYKFSDIFIKYFEGQGVNDFGYDVFLKREDAEKAIKEERL